MHNTPKKIFIECTYTHFSELNTGIQRVVRKLVTLLPDIAKEYGFEVQPVALQNGNFIEIEKLNSIETNLARNQKQLPVSTLRHAYYVSRKGVAILLPHPKVKHFLFAHRNEFGINYLLDKTVVRGVRKVKSLINPSRTTPGNTQQRINASKGDILLLLDSSWHMNIWKAVEQMRTQGMRPLTIAYDLIPILHPQFLNESLVYVFRNWFRQAALRCDGFIAISKTVQAEIEQKLAEMPEIKATDKFTGHFTLGADFLNPDATPQTVRKQLKKMFSQQKSATKQPNTYLSVGTLEPRKNHQYLLDAFDRLWDQGLKINLCLVGKCGWQYSEILARVKHHRLYKKNLFLWNDLNDNELAYCYQQSRTLLFASHAEGFGLPIIEGLQFGLNVMASDIPVHKEVGKGNIDYFKLDDPDDLARKIAQQEAEGFSEKVKPAASFKWSNWEQSAQSLMQEITRFSQTPTREATQITPPSPQVP